MEDWSGNALKDLLIVVFGLMVEGFEGLCPLYTPFFLPRAMSPTLFLQPLELNDEVGGAVSLPGFGFMQDLAPPRGLELATPWDPHEATKEDALPMRFSRMGARFPWHVSHLVGWGFSSYFLGGNLGHGDARTWHQDSESKRSKTEKDI